MKIVLIVEGDTETALRDHLKTFLDQRARMEGKPRVGLETRETINRQPNELRHRVNLELRNSEVIAVVGLIDVHPNFKDAAEAKAKLMDAVNRCPGFYAHAAQFEIEAWLLPYWDDICRYLDVNQKAPGGNPELIDHDTPPSHRLQELYRRAKPRPRRYVKTTEMFAILQGKDLTVAAHRCPEFKAFLNTLLTLSDLEPLG